MKTLQRFALVSLLSVLSACGFSPIYGTHGGADKPVIEALNAVQIENIPDRNGQMLKNKLMDRMYAQGRPQSPTARLTVSLSTSETSLGVQKDATTTRSQLMIAASFDLTDTSGRLLHRGAARSTVGYSKLDAQYGTLASQKNAYERGINEVGEQIVNNLSLYFAEKASPAPQE